MFLETVSDPDFKVLEPFYLIVNVKETCLASWLETFQFLNYRSHFRQWFLNPDNHVLGEKLHAFQATVQLTKPL